MALLFYLFIYYFIFLVKGLFIYSVE